MSAIITPTFRRNAVNDFKAGIDNVNNNYYIGIGRLIPWPNNIGDNSEVISEENSLFNEPLPQVTLAEEKDVRDELMTLVKVEESSAMIPKNLWSANQRRRYKRYDPTDPLTFELEGNLYPCVTVSDDKIYLCLCFHLSPSEPASVTHANAPLPSHARVLQGWQVLQLLNRIPRSTSWICCKVFEDCILPCNILHID